MEGLLAILIIPLIVNAIISAVITAIIIKTKGGDDNEVAMFSLYGFFLGIIAIVHAIVRHRTLEEERNRHTLAGRIACHLCDEYISPKAVVCPFCQRNIKQNETPAAQPASASKIGNESQSTPTTDDEQNIEQDETHTEQSVAASDIGDETQSAPTADNERIIERNETPAAQPATASEIGDDIQASPATEQQANETNSDFADKIFLYGVIGVGIAAIIILLFVFTPN